MLGRKKRSADGAGDVAGHNQLTCIQEMYLIENRLRKVPYKCIAAHLHKTDLACRLHYYQLGSANSRQDRTLSMSSTSVASQSADSTHLPSTTAMRRHSSPGVTSDSPGRGRSTSVETVSTVSPPPHPDVTILPKPVSTPHQRENPLRLHTTDLSASQQRATPKIDEVRLRQAYRSVYPHFWALVAHDYGSDVTPATLEEAWCNMKSTVTGIDPPPTPCVSPLSVTAAPSVLGHPFSAPKQIECPTRFHAINEIFTGYPVAITAEKSSFPISSLLTEEKEVRNHGESHSNRVAVH